jgi:hypothetical protein
MIGYCNVSSSALPNTFSDHIESVRSISTGKTEIAPVGPIEVYPHAVGLVRSKKAEHTTQFQFEDHFLHFTVSSVGDYEIAAITIA